MALTRSACFSFAAAVFAAVPALAAPESLAAVWAQTRWGETVGELAGQFGADATVLQTPLDFGDSYAGIVLRNVALGGVPVVVFFQMDKRSGGLKRIQAERPPHGVNPAARRAILAALAAAYGVPDAGCGVSAALSNGFQAGAEWLWRRRRGTIGAIARDTTIEAFEGCLGSDIASGYCGLTGQLLVRISPPGQETDDCAAPRRRAGRRALR